MKNTGNIIYQLIINSSSISLVSIIFFNENWSPSCPTSPPFPAPPPPDGVVPPPPVPPLALSLSPAFACPIINAAAAAVSFPTTERKKRRKPS